MKLKTKRIYDAPQKADGLRILVDRLWPRGVSKAAARVDYWLKEVAPSDALRTWFGHRAERWTEFKSRYRGELKSPPAQEGLERLRSLARGKTVTLLFAAKDMEHNNAVALMQYLHRTHRTR
jgi:uncharacterized protein YeaO (DUF488 family)